MKFHLVIVFLAFTANVQSKPAETEKADEIAKEFLSLLKKKSSSDKRSQFVECRRLGDPRVYRVGETFLRQVAGGMQCESCTVDSSCQQSCVPSSEPHCYPGHVPGAPPMVCRAPAPQHWVAPGESFSMIDGCYTCKFDNLCSMTCDPDKSCGKAIKQCEYSGKYYGVGDEFEGTCKPGSCEFNEFCQKSCMCARDLLERLLTED